MPYSPMLELALRTPPPLCRRGIPLGVGIPDLSTDIRRGTGVTGLCPSLSPSASSRNPLDSDMEWA
jgi:hypothetical protein